jgi:hypothetical protein
VVGELAASEELKSGDKLIIVDLNPRTLGVFKDAGFVDAVAPGYAPLCTTCPAPENPYGGGSAYWTEKVYLKGLAATSVVSSQRTFTELVVPLPASVGGGIGPISDVFGYRTRVLRR